MKKLNAIVNSMNSMTSDELSKIINNTNVSVDELTESEKFAVLIFNEMQKAFTKDKDYELVLDCNYSKSKNSVALVDYYRLIDKSSNSSLIQLYVSCSVKTASCRFRLCTSCAESVIEQLQSLKFCIKRDRRTHRAKTSERRNVDFNDIVSVVKSVCAVFTNKTAETTDESATTTAE